jgi:hypothetical protein
MVAYKPHHRIPECWKPRYDQTYKEMRRADEGITMFSCLYSLLAGGGRRSASWLNSSKLGSRALKKGYIYYTREGGGWKCNRTIVHLTDKGRDYVLNRLKKLK